MEYSAYRRTPEETAQLEKAERLLKKGNISTAADIYIRFLKKNPTDLDGLYGMGCVSQKTGQYDKALGFFEKLIEIEALNPLYYVQRGYVRQCQNRIDDAMTDYRKALAIDDGCVEAWHHVSENFLKSQHVDVFCDFCLSMLKNNPKNNSAWCALGNVYTIQGNLEAARDAYEQAIAIDENQPNPHYNIANIYHWLGRYGLAIESYRRAIQLDPTMYEAVENLATTCVLAKQPEKAIQIVKTLLQKSKDHPKLLLVLAQAYRGIDNYRKALEMNKRLMALYPNEAAYVENALLDAMSMDDEAELSALSDTLIKMPNITSNGIALLYNNARKKNDWETAQRLWPQVEKAIEEPVTQKSYGRNFANLNLISDPKTTIPLMRRAHEKAAEALRKDLPKDWRPDHHKAFEPTSRIRVGVVSGDFYSHVVSHFVNGWFKFFDRSRFELFAYANVPEKRRDSITKAYQATADHFLFVDKMTPRALAEQIQADGIHILMDLSGYTEGNLFETIVYKPAPVIATWLGYPATTGCWEIDYVISDRWADSPEHDLLFVEKALPLEDSIYVVGEYPNVQAEVNPPVLKNGFITFGSLMNPYKMNPDLFRVWAEIMNRVPNARMKLIHPKIKGIAKTNLINELTRAGFPMERLELIYERHPNNGNHLLYYNELDITLDTFPQTGGTTTFESLVMNVPVITKAGRVFLERLSNSIIHNSGLSEPDVLIAFSDDEYIEKAVALAMDETLLCQIRSELMGRIRASNLFSPRKHTRQLEEALQRAWNQKFPEQPLSKLLSANFVEDGIRNKFKKIQLTIQGYPVSFLTFDSENDPFNYILNEQDGWFDPEYRFVIDLMQPGEQFIDFSDDPGVYALPIAYKIGLNGCVQVYSRSSENRFFIEMMKPDNVTVERYETDLDLFGTADNAALIRISGEYNDDGKGGLIGKHIERLSEIEPLIFFSTRFSNAFDWTMLERLESAGFSLYRYMPGLDALTPFDRQIDADAFLSTLFACKGQREAELAVRGKLVLRHASETYRPDMLNSAFLGWLQKQAYANTLYSEWETVLTSEEKNTALEVYHAALSAWAVSQDTDQPMAIRYSALMTAISFLDPLAAVCQDGSLILTIVRVLADAGRRESAVLLLSQLKQQFEDGVCEFNWPFIPLSSDWEKIDPEEKLAEWLFASALETLECQRAYSSFFVGKEQIEPLQMVQAMGFYRPYVARRIELLRQRFL